MQTRRWISVMSAILLFNIVSISGCRQPTTQTIFVPVPTMTVSDADKLISENVGNQDFVILDVRTPDEYTARHITGAIDISYESAQFKNDVDKWDIKYNIWYIARPESIVQLLPKLWPG